MKYENYEEASKIANDMRIIEEKIRLIDRVIALPKTYQICFRNGHHNDILIPVDSTILDLFAKTYREDLCDKYKKLKERFELID